MTTSPITAPHPSWCRVTHSPGDPCLGTTEFVNLALMPTLEMEPGTPDVPDFFGLTIEGTHTDGEGLPSIELTHSDVTVAFMTVEEAGRLAVELVGLVTKARSAACIDAEGTAGRIDPQRVRATLLDLEDADGNVFAQRVLSTLGLARTDEVTR